MIQYELVLISNEEKAREVKLYLQKSGKAYFKCGKNMCDKLRQSVVY